jgi:MYXO-CTERM domain-containing protein
MLKHVITCASGLLATSTIASAAITFSFASDSHDADIFRGEHSGGQNQLATFSPVADLTLLVDPDSTTPGGVVAFDANFSINATTTAYQSSTFGGIVIHQWTMSGSFQFVDAATSEDILTVNFSQAVLTNVSSSSSTMGPSASLQSSFDIDPTLSFIAGPALNAIGISSTNLSEFQDFVYTLTSLRAIDGPGQPGLDPFGDWTTPWRSESSFSATATPAPGALALFALAGIVAARRRRM